MTTTQNTAGKCLEQGIEYHNEKRALSKEMNAIAKQCARETHINKKTIMKVKDYLHYRGRGWGDDCLTKSEDQEKYPDRVSPTFRNLYEIISNFYATGKEVDLQIYINALKERGITITVNKDAMNIPDNDIKEKIAVAINQMDPYQCDICEKNDYMNDVLAEAAESINLSPKNKYKQIVQLAASKQAGKDIDDRVQDEYLKMEMFTKGLEAVNDIHTVE